MPASSASAITRATVPDSSHYFGLAALLRMSMANVDMAPIGQALIQHALDDPNEAGSLMDAAVVMQFQGQERLVSQLQSEALKLRRHYVLPAKRPRRLRLLALMVPGMLMDNVPLECLLEVSDVELNLYYLGPESRPEDLPEHDLLFFAVSESETNRPIIQAWRNYLARWHRPVLNHPRNVLNVARDTASRLLHKLPGVSMPPTVRLSRAVLETITHGSVSVVRGLQFPLIVRPLDSHAGHDLYKIETPAALAEKLPSLPGDEFFVSNFIDYSGADGLFRKYRVILIDGQPHACHMGVSTHWMIHYLNAGMADSERKRAEEARWMANFEQDFAFRHRKALAAVAHVVGLNYLGIDCAETAEGELLIFEVDPAMVVHSMDPIDLYPYKPATMYKIFTAFRAMLMHAAGMKDAATKSYA